MLLEGEARHVVVGLRHQSRPAQAPLLCRGEGGQGVCVSTRWWISAVVNTSCPSGRGPSPRGEGSAGRGGPGTPRQRRARRSRRGRRRCFREGPRTVWLGKGQAGVRWRGEGAVARVARSGRARLLLRRADCSCASRPIAPATRSGPARKVPSSTADMASMTGARFGSGDPSGAKRCRSSSGFRPTLPEIRAA